MDQFEVRSMVFITKKESPIYTHGGNLVKSILMRKRQNGDCNITNFRPFSFEMSSEFLSPRFFFSNDFEYS